MYAGIAELLQSILNDKYETRNRATIHYKRRVKVVMDILDNARKSCDHDGWVEGCPKCDAEHALATAIVEARVRAEA